MYRNMIRHIHTYNVDDLPYTKYVNILLNPVSTEPISPPETPRRQELCLCLCMTLQTFWRSEGRFTNLFFSSTKKSAMQTCVDLTGICSSMFFFVLSLSPSLPPSIAITKVQHRAEGVSIILFHMQLFWMQLWLQNFDAHPCNTILHSTLPSHAHLLRHLELWTIYYSIYQLSMLGKSVPFLPF